MPNGQSAFGEILPSLLAALKRLQSHHRVQSLDAGGDSLLSDLQGNSHPRPTTRRSGSANRLAQIEATNRYSISPHATTHRPLRRLTT